MTILSPRKSLNKAYLKVKPSRDEIELFKANLIKLLDGLDESESEEHLKNDLSGFLRDTFHQKFYVNTKGRNDLVIHNGPDAKSAAGVLVEAKKPSNKTEMIGPGNLNVKAFHELILYYLRERITGGNLEIRHLIATNIYEWFIFDATIFEKTFAQNKVLVKQFTDFEDGRLAGTTTDFFYNAIAEPFISGLASEICLTTFDFRDYDKTLRNNDKNDDSKLIALYKLLSPEHLLKLPFSNDSNSLDKSFYSELLHIIGLTETKEGSKKLIGRKKEGQRDPGSLIENVIVQIDSRDMVGRLEKPSRFGENLQERLFNVALELAITWINRILFLKLLEAQLVSYHKGDPAHVFLNSNKIKGFDVLDSLFFRVLSKKTMERDPAVAELFDKVPYMNSSLFEPTELERGTIFISNLQDDCPIAVHPATVLKNNTGKRLSGNMKGLDYLFAFLDAYDFSSEGAEEIQEENKTLINASVLGLIFEKINGYKDGSFFTPGFITMYMCRETIRRAVVQKFNALKGWDCKDLDGLYDKIEDRKEANGIINQLKICDPAVGSGHFLVSALNEIIAIKGELKILSDKAGKRLKEYHVEVANDELIVTDEDGELFEYNPKNPESQRIQEALFHEKQTIIENCLFGVDINPNSVKICRLRLWIELLKNAYYSTISPSHNFAISPSHNSTISPSHNFAISPSHNSTISPSHNFAISPSHNSTISPSHNFAISPSHNSTISPSHNFAISPSHNSTISPSHNFAISPFYAELETLPNIDINIKCGNSLISRYALDADLKQVLSGGRFSINSYRAAIMTYRNAENKEQKREMEQLIAKIKSAFHLGIGSNDPRIKKRDQILSQIIHKFSGNFLFEPEAVYGDEKAKEKGAKEQKRMEAEVARLNQQIEDAKNNKVYENAFEWRYEFPEVLNDEGDFVGFDVVIGNPPYGVNFNKTSASPYENLYRTFNSRGESYTLFIERAVNILRTKGQFGFIIPDTILNLGFTEATRMYLLHNATIREIDLLPTFVFPGATVDTILLLFEKTIPENRNEKNEVFIKIYKNSARIEGLDNPDRSFYMDSKLWEKLKSFNIQSDNRDLKLLQRIDDVFQSLGEYCDVFSGIKVYEVGKGNPPQTKDILNSKPFTAKDRKSESWFPLFDGKNIGFYELLWHEDNWINYGEWLAAPRDKQNFDSEKILIRKITSSRLIAHYIPYTSYCNTLLFVVKLKPGIVRITYKALLGILNSTFIGWYFRKKFQINKEDTFPQIMIRDILQIAVPNVNNETTKELEAKVSMIIEMKQSNDQLGTKDQEDEVDRLVYGLYGLTEEEIKIVGNSYPAP